MRRIRPALIRGDFPSGVSRAGGENDFVLLKRWIGFVLLAVIQIRWGEATRWRYEIAWKGLIAIDS
jgi:hypothetical protein